MRHRLFAAGLAASLILGILVVPAAAFANVREHDTVRVIDGLTHSRITASTTSGATVRGQVIRVPQNTFAIKPRSARNTMVGLETNQVLAQRERDAGAVMGINGGYWLSRPGGVPNGLHVEDGQMTAGRSALRSGSPIARAAVGFRNDGQLLFDRLNTTISLTGPFGEIAVDELNRQVRTTTDGTRIVSGELLLFDDKYGAAITAPTGSTIITVDALSLATNSAANVTATNVVKTTEETRVSVAQGGGLIVAYGSRSPDVATVTPGTELSLTTSITPLLGAPNLWDNLTHAVAGGPHLISNGSAQSLTRWREEGFSDTHLTGRSPRTAIGRTQDGTVLLVTIDGRQPGWSAGMNLRELTALMQNLGARDAVNLDGGGSTVMTKNASIVNRPSETRRSVANGLFVYAPLPNRARSTERACGTQLASAPFVDTASSVHVQAIHCLSQYAITSGKTATEFDPQGDVSRGQMATFLATFIDQMASRGGRSLASTDAGTFADVFSANVHKANIERLAAAGIVSGKTTTTFTPSESVTRAQTARMIAETLRYVTGQPLAPHRDTFIDDSTSVHEETINQLNGVGVITGVGGFAFNPSGDVTRAAMASFLMRSADHLIETGTVS